MTTASIYCGNKEFSTSFPFNTKAIGMLKEIVPAVHRTWVVGEQVWRISSEYYSEVMELLRENFSHVELYNEKGELEYTLTPKGIKRATPGRD